MAVQCEPQQERGLVARDVTLPASYIFIYRKNRPYERGGQLHFHRRHIVDLQRRRVLCNHEQTQGAPRDGRAAPLLRYMRWLHENDWEDDPRIAVPFKWVCGSCYYAYQAGSAPGISGGLALASD